VKRTAHRLDRAEPAAPRDLLDRLLRAVERDAGGLDPRRLHVDGGRHADLPAKGTREVARAHAGPFCKGGDRQVLAEMVGDPCLKLAQRLPLGDLGRQLRAELRLAARTLQEEHEPAGNLERRAAAEVLLDQCEAEVHPGGHSGGGVDVAVLHEYRIRLDVDRGVAAAQGFARRPVRRRPVAVEEPCPGQQESPAAHRRDSSRSLRGARDPADQPRVIERVGDTLPADDHERVDRAAAGPYGAIGAEVQAARGRDLSLLGGDDLERVGPLGQPGGHREHLGGTGQVERLKTVERKQDDAASVCSGSHATHHRP
jgi:hypothetical protein